MSSAIRDLTGQKFNKLTVTEKVSATRSGSITWKCICDCGNEKIVSSDHLTRKVQPVKSCGCTRFVRGNSYKHRKEFDGISEGWWYNHVSRERKQTKRPKVSVTITKEYAWQLFLKQERKCALSGVDLMIAGDHKFNTASVDRIDSSKGYEEGNIQWVHKHVNFMKRTYSQEYFIEMCTKIAENNT